ncbi:hypothetical protein ACFY97_32555 [Streptomyces klenkii]|uniref:hypothetical protein n=1 Tax=Streptomyces klenkii TaxID=1420899 RepID=UPI0036E3BD6B
MGETTAPTAADHPPTPDGEIDKLAEARGWAVDPQYTSAAAYVRDICESLPVSAVDGASRPQWLAGRLDGDSRAVLEVGIPKLCPKWTKTLEEAVSGDYEVWFGSGGYEVKAHSKPDADAIAPGTYRTRGDLENCYWERLTKAGDIIDNNFASAAREITVSVQPSDGLFKSEGCGVWKPVG